MSCCVIGGVVIGCGLVWQVTLLSVVPRRLEEYLLTGISCQDGKLSGSGW